MSTPDSTNTEITRAEYCVTACADIFTGAGEIMASPMAPTPLLGARLARLTTEQDLLITDGEALILADTPAIGKVGPTEGWMPFRKVFDVVASGRRHVVMGANQIDRFGNQNLSAFGPLQHPTRQMFGVRGAPGNTINHPTSYWVARHSSRVFVDDVDIVSGVGFDKVDERNPAFDSLNIHRVVTNLGVFDFNGPGHTMQALSLHPGVTADEVAENTSFPIAGLDNAPVTATPTDEQLRIIREVLDPKGVRNREVK
ncbi:putative CoA-transferase beta subunit [Gordonia spumicola]|uniref:Putative CoA-transferase beta subunit n=1 Tax=Gordonia spumicola TaxID=589161 RepID=A0A7I9V454_9ACTN|nr:CoA-transferase [Gordonia spumicola]GED99962.1 putative CoA-transferase beta subunit [Gordonia spumicola]